MIDVPRMRERLPEAPDTFFIKPSAIANELWHLLGRTARHGLFLPSFARSRKKW
jgi:hypothetical protein